MTPGVPFCAWLEMVWISPAVAIEPPLGNSTVVSWRRVRKPGTLMPSMTDDVAGSISETSVASRSEMRPEERTTGVKFKRHAIGLVIHGWHAAIVE